MIKGNGQEKARQKSNLLSKNIERERYKRKEKKREEVGKMVGGSLGV